MWRSTCAALALAALFAQGCGTSGGTSASFEKFLPAAVAICQQLNVDIAHHTPKKADRHKIGTVAIENAFLEQAALNGLKKLKPPAIQAPEWQRLLLYRQRLMEQLARLGQAETRNEQHAAQALIASKKRVHRELIALAGRSQLAPCALTG